MMFDGSKEKPWFERSSIKIGEGLFKMHKVEVSYELSDKIMLSYWLRLL